MAKLLKIKIKGTQTYRVIKVPSKPKPKPKKR